MIQALTGLAPFQIAFVVHDLERAAQRFEALLGAGPWRGYVFDEATAGGRLYHGRPADWSLRLALNDKHPQYELIQPLAGPSIHAEWLAQRGEGFHHIGYIVESIDELTVDMEAAGHAPVMEVHSFGVNRDGRGVYFDTVEALGCFVEAVEPPARMPLPSFTPGSSVGSL